MYIMPAARLAIPSYLTLPRLLAGTAPSCTMALPLLAHHARPSSWWCPYQCRQSSAMTSNTTAAHAGQQPRQTQDPMESDFRLVMRQQAFPVCVIGSVPSADEAKPSPAAASSLPTFRFATLSSFTSVSLTPPIISFALRDPSRIGDLILSRPDRRFTLHLLAQDQAHLSQQFADPKTQTSLEPNVHVSQWLHGQFPILDGCLAVLECQAEKPIVVGDHTMWFGRVVQVVEAAGGRKPLLYMDRKYTTTVAPAPTAKAITAKHN